MFVNFTWLSSATYASSFALVLSLELVVIAAAAAIIEVLAATFSRIVSEIKCIIVAIARVLWLTADIRIFALKNRSQIKIFHRKIAEKITIRELGVAGCASGV